MSLKITEVKCYTSKNPGVVLGNGSVTFNSTFYCKFIIMQGKDGNPFVSWPSKKGKDKDGADKWYSDAGFVIDETAGDKYATKNEFENLIISEFNKTLAVAPSAPASTIPAAPNDSAPNTAVVAKTKPRVKAKNW